MWEAIKQHREAGEEVIQWLDGTCHQLWMSQHRRREDRERTRPLNALMRVVRDGGIPHSYGRVDFEATYGSKPTAYCKDWRLAILEPSGKLLLDRQGITAAGMRVEDFEAFVQREAEDAMPGGAARRL